MSESDEMSVTEIAEMLGLHTATIRAWIREERISARKDGRRWLLRRSDVEQLLRDEPSLGKPHRANRSERRDSTLASARRPDPEEGPRAYGTGILESGLL